MGRLFLFVPVAIFIGLAGLLYRGLSLDPTQLPSALIDRELPEFNLRKLGTEDYIVRDNILGRVSLLNVWGTWCPTCVAEHPYLMKLAAEGVPIIGLNYKDEDTKALGWLVRLGDPYSVNITDPNGDFGLDLGVYGAPETYVIDALGVIRYRHVGEVNQRTWSGELGQAYRELIE